IKIHRGRCARHGLVEIANTSASFPNVTRRAVGIKHAMAGYHAIRMQSLNLIERAQPLASGLFIALAEVEPSPAIESPVGLDDSCKQLVHGKSPRRQKG